MQGTVYQQVAPVGFHTLGLFSRFAQHDRTANDQVAELDGLCRTS
jgi:hypothetical protein